MARYGRDFTGGRYMARNEFGGGYDPGSWTGNGHPAPVPRLSAGC